MKLLVLIAVTIISVSATAQNKNVSNKPLSPKDTLAGIIKQNIDGSTTIYTKVDGKIDTTTIPGNLYKMPIYKSDSTIKYQIKVIYKDKSKTSL